MLNECFIESSQLTHGFDVDHVVSSAFFQTKLQVSFLDVVLALHWRQLHFRHVVLALNRHRRQALPAHVHGKVDVLRCDWRRQLPIDA